MHIGTTVAPHIGTTVAGGTHTVASTAGTTATTTTHAAASSSVSVGGHIASFLSTSVGAGVTIGNIFTGIGIAYVVYKAEKLAEWLGLYQSIAGFSCYLGASTLWHNEDVKGALKAFVASQTKENALKLYNALRKAKSSYCPLVTDENKALVKATFYATSGKQKSIDVELFKTFAKGVMESLS